MKKRGLIEKCAGAVIGAGLASGREVSSFFARWGPSWPLGVLMAMLTLLLLSTASMPENWRGRWLEKAWTGMFTALLTGTGSAMLSAAGVLAARVCPGRWTCFFGAGMTLTLACLLGKHEGKGLKFISGLLIFLMLTSLTAGILLPASGETPSAGNLPQAILHGFCYGGFNAALLSPVLVSLSQDERERRGALRASVLIMGGMLALGCVALNRHPELMADPMPFLALLSRLGSVGLAAGLAGIYLAVLTTLSACVGAMQGRVLPLLAMGLLALTGFERVVGELYPMLGAGGLLMLLLSRVDKMRQI